jgi:hypothetical protein
MNDREFTAKVAGAFMDATADLAPLLPAKE